MDTERVREARAIPLPRGPEPESWVMDVTPQRWLRETFVTDEAPYTFTPCGVRVRLLMPRRGRRRTLDVLARLTEQAAVPWIRKEMAQESGASPEGNAEQVATHVLTRAVYEPNSPFLIYLIWPNGRTVCFSGRFEPPHFARRSWHPKSPGRGEQR